MGQIMPQPFRHPKTGVYYFRKVVPAALRAAVGKREIRISLRTKDVREAKKNYPGAAANAEALLNAATQRGQPLPQATELTDAQIKRAADAYFAHLLEEDEELEKIGYPATQLSAWRHARDTCTIQKSTQG